MSTGQHAVVEVRRQLSTPHITPDALRASAAEHDQQAEQLTVWADQQPPGGSPQANAAALEACLLALDHQEVARRQRRLVDYWIYGHNHCDKNIDALGTKFRSNQFGYSFKMEHIGFDFKKVIEL